jgi:hypothetical protein
LVFLIENTILSFQSRVLELLPLAAELHATTNSPCHAAPQSKESFPGNTQIATEWRFTAHNALPLREALAARERSVAAATKLPATATK